jgi:transglutaminase-like putative cysteine protease
VKILRASGSHHGFVTEPFSPNRKVKHLKGWIHQEDGTLEEVGEENVVEVDASTAAGYYDDSHFLLARPDLEVGSIVGYEYQIEEKGLPSLFQSFTFQVQQPVDRAIYSVKIPKGWEHESVLRWGEDIFFEPNEEMLIWSASDLAYRPDEPNAPSWAYLRRSLELTVYDPVGEGQSCFPDWRSVASWTSNLHREAAAPDDAVAGILAQVRPDSGTTTEETLASIAEFVAEQIRYVAVEIGEGRWEPRMASRTLANRYGDCKDKTALMRAMLTSAGIPSFPVLANTDRSVLRTLPTPFQFNHCIVGIPLQGLAELPAYRDASVDGWIFFDPTDAETALGGLPPQLHGALVLVDSKDGENLLRLPYPPAARSHDHSVAVDAVLLEDGGVEAHVRIRDRGYRSVGTHHSRRVSSRNKLAEIYQSSLATTAPGARISDLTVDVSRDSSSIEFDVAIPSFAVSAGALWLLKMDFLTRSAVPDMKPGTRYHPIWFGAPEIQSTTYRWTLPPGWSLEDAVPPVDIACEGGRVTYGIDAEQGRLLFTSAIEFTGRLMSPEKYAEALELSKAQSSLKSLTVALVRSGP